MIDDSCIHVKLVSVLVLSYIVGIGSRVGVGAQINLELAKVEHSCCKIGWETSR